MRWCPQVLVVAKLCIHCAIFFVLMELFIFNSCLLVASNTLFYVFCGQKLFVL